ncbi:hypothetical protein MNBD_GAMMA09-2148 [hydrothermal vent metagenome]|uniref:PEP-CTERM protein-sorting domain-containing protein n=1 Tax=hydrothermal vent metagenome TaxID=652676 RepID=A0A3B0XQF2_9ZZZZ
MKKIKVILTSIVLLFTAGASAAPIAINSMFVDTATASLTVGILGPYTASTGINPPAEITMGSFQTSILAVSSPDYSLNIYSTGDFGAPAPSGTVDGTSINVDFSSLRGNLVFSGNTYDFGLWPVNTALDYGTYDPLTNAFNIGWTESLALDFGTAILDISLQGNLTTVPVPAAIWLFGSGMLALFGFSQRRRKFS